MTNDSKLTAAEAVVALDALTGQSDPEADHAEADRILLLAVPKSVRIAYAGLVKRSKWWATA
jgi:hypothetical protein